jgi:serine/threonine protein kinase
VDSAINKIESPPSGPTEVIVGSWFQLRECIAQSNGIHSHLGRSIDDGHAVVIKVIPAAAVHPGALMRLEYEATHLQRLQSPWLATIVHVGRENGDLLLVYENVAGFSLRECLESRRLSVNESLSVGRGIFSALRDMHQHRLLHRGVRPSNIIVDHREQVTKATLVDFDPTPALRLDDAAIRTQSLDAALYLSPEQAGAIDQAGDQHADVSADGRRHGRELRHDPRRRGERAAMRPAYFRADAARCVRRTHQERAVRLRGGGVRALGARRNDVIHASWRGLAGLVQPSTPS